MSENDTSAPNSAVAQDRNDGQDFCADRAAGGGDLSGLAISCGVAASTTMLPKTSAALAPTEAVVFLGCLIS
jgi:hypothetical protein